jgi:hypothetical protein
MHSGHACVALAGYGSHAVIPARRRLVAAALAAISAGARAFHPTSPATHTLSAGWVVAFYLTIVIGAQLFFREAGREASFFYCVMASVELVAAWVKPPFVYQHFLTWSGASWVADFLCALVYVIGPILLWSPTFWWF